MICKFRLSVVAHNTRQIPSSESLVLCENMKQLREQTNSLKPGRIPLEKESLWCQETGSEINPSKALVLRCNLGNTAAGQTNSILLLRSHRMR